jgi:osmotically-inducible protein OsmY
MAKRKLRPVKPPAISPDAGLSPDDLRLVEEAGQLVHAVDAAIQAAGLSIRRLTVAGGEGIVVLTGVARTAAVKRRAGEIAAAVPGATEVMNSIVVRR